MGGEGTGWGEGAEGEQDWGRGLRGGGDRTREGG